MADNNIENVIIIGGGPAGLAAALYNARASLKPLLFAGAPSGGQLMLTTEVENYLGFESILGPELIQKFRNHVLKFGVRILDQNILKVDFTSSPFTVTSVDKTYQSKAIIITTGAKALWLGLDSETRLRGKGVSACATCDGFFFKNKVVGVVGGGDTAMEEALTLSKFATKVYLIHRREEFRASKIMAERVKNHEKIEVILNTQVTEVLGTNKVEGLRIVSSKSNFLGSELASQATAHTSTSSKNLPSSETIAVDGLFLAIGHKPDTDLFKDQIELDQKGYIVTKDYMTSVKGVFAGGDCVDHRYRQAATAVGMGVAAALEAERYLELL